MLSAAVRLQSIDAAMCRVPVLRAWVRGSTRRRTPAAAAAGRCLSTSSMESARLAGSPRRACADVSEYDSRWRRRFCDVEALIADVRARPGDSRRPVADFAAAWRDGDNRRSRFFSKWQLPGAARTPGRCVRSRARVRWPVDADVCVRSVRWGRAGMMTSKEVFFFPQVNLR
jgi:hypothetical protein